MNRHKKIKNYTAGDIENYHRGLLSAAERHALEKAALDDPMLADALEGYATAGVKTSADIAELKKRLAEKIRTATGTVVTMRRSFWLARWKVAAMITLLAGAAFLVYRLAFVNKKQSDIVLQSQETQSLSEAESKTNPGVSTFNQVEKFSEEIEKNNDSEIKKNNRQTTQSAPRHSPQELMQSGATAKDTASITAKTSDIAVMHISEPANRNAGAPQYKAPAIADSKKQTDVKPDSGHSGITELSDQQSQGILARQKKTESPRMYYFRGRITDAASNPLPFANITNVRDHIGTYSDALGYFTLVSTDSVLDVQVRSLGYEKNNTRLRGNHSGITIMLQQDESIRPIVLSHYQPNAQRLQQLRQANISIEEPEPVDGWENYDTYLVNNRIIPDEKRKNRLQGQVELTFEINKLGQPVNIRIEKSLCQSCDEEAIRLLKEGPRWNPKGKKRARVTIPFDD